MKIFLFIVFIYIMLGCLMLMYAERNEPRNEWDEITLREIIILIIMLPILLAMCCAIIFWERLKEHFGK